MLFSRKFMWKMIIPLIAQRFLDVAIGMIDSIMVSSAGEAAVSGVSLIGMLDLLIMYTFSSLSVGGSVVVAQAYGRQEPEYARHTCKQLLYVVTGASLLVSGAVMLVRVPLLNLLFGSVEAEIMYQAQSYLFYILISFPFLAIYFACATVYQTMGKTSIPMVISLFVNVFNIAGNAIFIYGYHMGAAGAAISTMICRMLGAGVMLLLVRCKKNDLYIRRFFHYRPDFPTIKQILRIGVPNGLENSMFQFGKLLTQSLVSSLGITMIAANAVAQTIANFAYVPGQISTATVAIVGRCMGAEEQEQAKYYTKKLMLYSYLILWGIDIGLLLLSGTIIRGYHLSDASASLAMQLVIYHTVFSVLIWPISFSLPHAFRAANDIKFTLYVSSFSMWLFRVALSYVLALHTVNVLGLAIPGLGLGLMGVWIAMTVDWIFRAVLFGWRFVSGRWLTKYHHASIQTKHAQEEELTPSN